MSFASSCKTKAGRRQKKTERTRIKLRVCKVKRLCAISLAIHHAKNASQYNHLSFMCLNICRLLQTKEERADTNKTKSLQGERLCANSFAIHHAKCRGGITTVATCFLIHVDGKRFNSLWTAADLWRTLKTGYYKWLAAGRSQMECQLLVLFYCSIAAVVQLQAICLWPVIHGSAGIGDLRMICHRW